MQPTTPTIFEEPTLINRPDESRYAMDDKLYVEFFREPVMHQGKSREAGRAVYEERDFVRIHVPGDKTTVCVEPMHEINLFRFRARYEKWKAGQSEAVTGTPLSAMPGMTPSKVARPKPPLLRTSVSSVRPWPKRRWMKPTLASLKNGITRLRVLTFVWLQLQLRHTGGRRRKLAPALLVETVS